MQVLVSMCSKPMQVRHLDQSTEFQILLTVRRIYYMIEMALGPLLLVNMLISKTEIRGYLGMSVSERSVFLHRLPGG